MKNYLRFSFLAFALMFAINILTVSEAKAQVQEILKRMDEHQKALTSLRANVTMDKYNLQLDEHDIYEGSTMYVKVKERDALVKLEWVKPQQEILVVKNKEYVLYRPSLKQAIRGNTEKSKNGETSIFNFSKMSKEQLKANYGYKYFGPEEIKGGIPTWHLELTPKAEANYKSVDIWVDGNGMVLQTKVNEKNGDSTTVLLTGLRKNGDIKTSEFVLTLPKDTKIVSN